MLENNHLAMKRTSSGTEAGILHQSPGGLNGSSLLRSEHPAMVGGAMEPAQGNCGRRRRPAP
jgi:hypothetical protein